VDRSSAEFFSFFIFEKLSTHLDDGRQFALLFNLQAAKREHEKLSAEAQKVNYGEFMGDKIVLLASVFTKDVLRAFE